MLAGAEVSVPQDSWSNGIKTALPAAMCREGSYFRACFDVTEEQCSRTVTAATADCVEQFAPEMPALFNQPQDGQHWGQRVGGCAANGYMSAHKASKLDKPSCENAAAWK